MITGKEAISRSLQRYCTNGEFCVATGDGTVFSRYFYQEPIPFFDVEDATYWILDKSFWPGKPEAQHLPLTTQEPIMTGGIATNPTIPSELSVEGPKKIRSLTISGKVPLEHYTQLFNSFIMPLAQNNIEIEIRIKGKSTSVKPITDSSQEYKIIKESAKQLGLNLEEEL
jgi:hypothetical protein